MSTRLSICTVEFTSADVALLLDALNSHEGVLATEYEQAKAANSEVLARSLANRLQAVRDLANVFPKTTR